MNRLTLHKEVSVVGEYDVVVCGGSPAGLMASQSCRENTPVPELVPEKVKAILDAQSLVL